MSDKLITVSFPQNDSLAAHHFGEALIRLAAAIEERPYPVIGEEAPESHEYSGPVADRDILSMTVSPAEYEKLRNGGPVSLSVGAVLPPLQEEKVSDVPPPSPVAAPTEYPAGKGVYMVSPSEVDILIVSKFAERDDLLSKGWKILTAEEVANFERAEPGHPGDLDSEGLPWDERIHSGSKGKVKDGTWRLRKTPTDQTAEQWQQYVADIKVSLKEPDVAEQGDDFNTDTGTVTEETVAGIPPIAPPAIPAPPVVDAPTNLPPPTEYNGPKTFPELMAELMEHMEAVTPHMQILCSRAKIAHVRELKDNEAAIPAFYQDMVNTCGL